MPANLSENQVTLNFSSNSALWERNIVRWRSFREAVGRQREGKTPSEESSSNMSTADVD
jgi:hypothetical protein